MCSIGAYNRLYKTGNDNASSGGGILISDKSTTDAQK